MQVYSAPQTPSFPIIFSNAWTIKQLQRFLFQFSFSIISTSCFQRKSPLGQTHFGITSCKMWQWLVGIFKCRICDDELGRFWRYGTAFPRLFCILFSNSSDITPTPTKQENLHNYTISPQTVYLSQGQVSNRNSIALRYRDCVEVQAGPETVTSILSAFPTIESSGVHKQKDNQAISKQY